MTQRRSDVAQLVSRVVGADMLELEPDGTGWPTLARMELPGERVRVLLHVGPITLSKRGRDAVERRFQNPGQNRPIRAEPGALSLLLGIDLSASPAVLVGMDAMRRVGDVTRFSLFMPLHLIETARNKGWAEHFSDTGERIIAFVPALLPTYVEMVRAAVHLDSAEIQNIIEASGVVTDPTKSNEERGRATASRLIRAGKFREQVRTAYEGRCAMCGLDHSLVVGAHIFPAEAPGSRDEVWNGLALCYNHHAAFDSHVIYVHPESRRVIVHASLHEDARTMRAAQAFINTTFEQLVEPRERRARPLPNMFVERYRFYDPKYGWAL